jgi:tetratricopeptide (TPR) repeat protein
MVKIKYLWLIITITILLSSCSGLRSVRNSRIISPKQVNQKIETPIAEKEIESIPVVAEQRQIDTADYSKFAGIVGSRIPSLREQMQNLAKTQDTMKDDLSRVKSDIQEIKNLISDLRGTVDDYIPAGTKLPFTGSVKEKQNIENETPKQSYSSKLLADEKSNDVRPVKKPSYNERQNITKKAISETFLASDEKASKKETPPKPKIVEKDKQIAKPVKPEIIAVNDNSRLNEGKEQFANRRYSEAIETLKNALLAETSKKQESEINFLIGESYYFMGDYVQSIDFMNKVLSSQESQYLDGARIRKAEANLKSGKIIEAKADYQALIRNHPSSNYVPKARKMLQQL